MQNRGPNPDKVRPPARDAVTGIEEGIDSLGRIGIKALGAFALLLFILALIGIGYVVEMHTFRASVGGKVTDAHGDPIAGAKVEYCLPNASNDTIAYDAGTKTDSQGRYSMKLPTCRAALDTSPNRMRQTLISTDGYVPFCTHKIPEKGRNLSCDYVLSADPSACPRGTPRSSRLSPRTPE